MARVRLRMARRGRTNAAFWWAACVPAPPSDRYDPVHRSLSLTCVRCALVVVMGRAVPNAPRNGVRWTLPPSCWRPAACAAAAGARALKVLVAIVLGVDLRVRVYARC